MSIFYCDICHKNQDSDLVGFVVLPDGREVCDDAVPEESDEESEWESMPPSQKREAMGGPNGGDGDDD